MANSEQRVNIGFALSIIASLALVLLGYGWFFQSYQNEIYPGVSIHGVKVDGLSKAAAIERLAQQLPTLPQRQITIVGEKITLSSSSAELKEHYQIEEAVNQALTFGRQGNPLQRAWGVTQLIWQPIDIALTARFEQPAVAAMVRELAVLDEVPGRKPSIELKTSQKASSLEVDAGEAGHVVELAPTIDLVQELANTSTSTVAAIVAPTNYQLSPDQIAAAKARAEHLVGHQGIWKGQDLTFKLNDQQLVSLLDLPEGYNPAKLADYSAEWVERVSRPPQDAEFEYDPTTLKVTSFKPDKPGLTLNQAETEAQVLQWLAELEQTPLPETPSNKQPEPKQFELVLATTQANKTLSSTNDLGIVQRIGLGESEYAHSIPSRIHNVALAASRISNIVIKPGEEFSFNKALGDVSAATGFQPAYVIKSGQTVLGDGGGVCQVSTTLFRSVLDAGLPVTKRKAHSYRVSYYELDQKPGIDATVYSGDVDLRFINDTNHHILIHTETDSKNLYMRVELYGTSDGRTTEITEHKTWDYRPAPAPVYIPDASLPTGKTKQVDWAASGIRASFRHIVRDKTGAIIRDQTYASNYIPWSAKYLRGI